MLATGLRASSLAKEPSNGGLSFDERGICVGDVPLLTRTPNIGAPDCWAVRPINEINDDLTTVYRWPIDAGVKASALALIAKALNHSDLTLALVAAAQMRFPNPPPPGTCVERDEEVTLRAAELHHSGLLKFCDPAKHPRTGTPPNPGEFAPVGEGSESSEAIPAAMPGNPWDKPVIVEGGGGGGVPRGQLELPFPRLRWPWQSSPETPDPAPTPTPGGAQPKLPFPGGLPRQAAPTGSPTEPPSEQLPSIGHNQGPPLEDAPELPVPTDAEPELPFPSASSGPTQSEESTSPSPPAEQPATAPSSKEEQPRLRSYYDTPPQLAPYQQGNPTSGVFRAGNLMFELQADMMGPRRP